MVVHRGTVEAAAGVEKQNASAAFPTTCLESTKRFPQLHTVQAAAITDHGGIEKRNTHVSLLTRSLHISPLAVVVVNITC
jgi:hypothetical protein